MSVQHERLIELCNELRLGGIADAVSGAGPDRGRKAHFVYRLPRGATGRRARIASGAGTRNVRAGGRLPGDQDA